MGKRTALLAVTVLICEAASASGPDWKSEQGRQISEVVFQNYPPRARAAGEEGPVFFEVTLDKDAHPTSCAVTHGSGHPLLDSETCALIVSHAVFNSARDVHGRLMRETAEGVVNWTLPGHTPAPINVSSAAATTRPEPQICKKTLRTGTLSSFERTCMTPTEWANQSEEQKRPYEEMQGRKGNTSGDVSCIGPSGC
ncbi:MAG TPA: energy transducer TonB [Sphingomicrobium sp.]|nr:energy transducer TonB [Sphingomicrobium sp.]